MSGERSPLKYLLAGGFGGLCTVITGHPLDTVKVRLQTMPDMYRGTWDVVKKTVAKEGPLGLYKGVGAPLASVVPMFAISFLGFGFGKQLLRKPEQEKLNDQGVFFAGMFSGACTVVITAPAERIKCLLQMQVETPTRYNGFLDCAVKLWREGGVRNLFLGTWPTILRDVPATGVFFYTYERVLRVLLSQKSEALVSIQSELPFAYRLSTDRNATWQPMLAGGVAGIANWLLAMPADVVKSRIQCSTDPNAPKNMWPAFVSILGQGGPGALYRGVLPVMLRAFPANAACCLGLEFGLGFLDLYAPWL